MKITRESGKQTKAKGQAEREGEREESLFHGIWDVTGRNRSDVDTLNNFTIRHCARG